VKRKILVTLLLSALFVGPQQAWSYGPIPVIDYAHIVVTTWAEYLRYAQAAYSIIQQATQIYNQVQQIENQVQALKKLNFHSWRDIGPLYHQLEDLLNQADTLTYTVDNLDERFSAAFPGTSDYLSFPDEQSAGVSRTLDTFRLNLESLHQIHEDSKGSLQVLGDIQQQIDEAEGHEEALEALGELASWQADAQATEGSTLQSIANGQLVFDSYMVNQDARSKQTATDTINATLARAQADALQPAATYSVLPSWMPQ
jgi:P-type conjugative transfer protein TrbJ